MLAAVNQAYRCKGIRLALILLLYSLPFSGRAGEAAAKSAGLFIGIGKFDFRTGLKPLVYAPDDAIALAYRFVVESKEIAPAQARLVLGGEPKSLQGQEQLMKLKGLGVAVHKGTRSACREAIKDFTQMVSPMDGQVVVTFSGHGYELSEGVFLMPTDGDWQLIKTKGIAFDALLEPLKATKAKSKILLVDTCREIPDRTQLDTMKANEQFQKQLSQITPLTALISCRAGEKSWQSNSLEHGVFTHSILQEFLPGEAWKTIADKVIRRNEDWVKKLEDKRPHPWFVTP